MTEADQITHLKAQLAERDEAIRELNHGASKAMKACYTCLHIGTLKGRAGVYKGHVCLAPITTEPPKDGETRAKHPFVYQTEIHNFCELWTPNPTTSKWISTPENKIL